MFIKNNNGRQNIVHHFNNFCLQQAWVAQPQNFPSDYAVINLKPFILHEAQAKITA
ncbi:MAG TPA: hypothetical protein VLL03_07170 [Burkholderiales bacterium]|nr:hypothetical protein [Burkholderiales bacterium]